MLIAQLSFSLLLLLINENHPKICQNQNIDHEYLIPVEMMSYDDDDQSILPDDQATEVFNIVGSAVSRMTSRGHLGLEIFISPALV